MGGPLSMRGAMQLVCIPFVAQQNTIYCVRFCRIKLEKAEDHNKKMVAEWVLIVTTVVLLPLRVTVMKSATSIPSSIATFEKV
jgi:hypothetical protein